MILEIPTKRASWCQVLAHRPGVHLRIEQMVPLPNGGCRERVVVKGAAPADVEAGILAADDVRDLSFRRQIGGRTSWIVESSDCPLVRMMQQSSVVPEMPMEVCRGADRILVIDQKERLQAMFEALRQSGQSPRVIWSGEWQEQDNLTPHQRMVLEAAVAVGYYAHPRRMNLTQLAGKLGVTKSTLSQTIMRIEERVMQHHLGH